MMLKTQCMLCPRNCKADRKNGQKGYCGAADKIQVARASLHMWEEPCISGDKGSGTIFFSGCPLRCIFCQNRDIALGNKGIYLSESELSAVFLRLQEKGAHNINLVTPTHFVPQIVCALNLAKEKGLKIPIVYNTNAYEKVETLKLLEGYIDIYLPDLKYADNFLAKKYSNIRDYFEIATKAIKEMVRQVGMPKISEEGIMQKGVMIRHLVLPNHVRNSKKVLKWIKENLPNEIYISVMAQYFPTYQAKEIESLNRKLTKEEWEEIEDYIEMLGIENGYVQDLGEHEEEFVPKWEME